MADTVKSALIGEGAVTGSLDVGHKDNHAERQAALESWNDWVAGSRGETAPWESADFLRAKELFAQHGLSSLWHMTHKNNIRGILDRGILSHNEAWRSCSITDISDAEVQRRRTVTEPVFGRPLHQYAPLYVNVRNPMLFRLQDQNNELCLLEVSLDILRDTATYNLLCADGNAAAAATRFYRGLEGFGQLPWQVLSPEFWNDQVDGKRRRCAEVLIHPGVPARYIARIHCYSRSLANSLRGSHPAVVHNPGMFFGA